MLATERKEKIMSLLKEQRTATLEELSTITQASVSTLRRDLNELEEENALRRVHGGAELQQDLQKSYLSLRNLPKTFKKKKKSQL